MRALERRLKVRFAELASEFEDEVAAGECEAPSAALAKIAAGRLKPRSFMHGRVVEALLRQPRSNARSSLNGSA